MLRSLAQAASAPCRASQVVPAPAPPPLDWAACLLLIFSNCCSVCVLVLDGASVVLAMHRTAPLMTVQGRRPAGLQSLRAAVPRLQTWATWRHRLSDQDSGTVSCHDLDACRSRALANLQAGTYLPGLLPSPASGLDSSAGSLWCLMPSNCTHAQATRTNGPHPQRPAPSATWGQQSGMYPR